MLSVTATHQMILAWKRARMHNDTAALGYPRENILAKAGRGRSLRPPPIPDGEMTDAELVQKVVDRMPNEMKRVFEAYHLMLVDDSRCRCLPHKIRASALGITPKTYRMRVRKAFEFCRIWLDPFTA
jgi:hypothetical protein